MLRYFIIRPELAPLQTTHATPLTFRAANAYTGKTIPFTHIYVASDPYSRRIKKKLGDQAKHFEEINKNQRAALLKDKRYPVDLKGKNFSTLDQLRTKIRTVVGDKTTVNIVVVNGIGTGFGDNYVGLGAIQRLTNLLAPLTVNFHLMQTMNERAMPIYMRENNVFLHNNCMPMNEFLQKDFLVNLTGMLGFPEFNKLPLAQFMSHAFSIQKLVPQSCLHPKLNIDVNKVNSIKLAIANEFEQKKPVALFHPKASSPVRTMHTATATAMVKELVSNGYNVVSAFPYANPQHGYKDISTLSKSIDDLLHIIAACDMVVSVGTVVYHLAAAMNKPTLLLPTVRADIESAKLLPEVLCWVPEASKEHILDLHKSREDDDVKTAKQIWNKLDIKQAVLGLDTHYRTFSPRAPKAPHRIGVVIPHFGSQQKLDRCLDALVNVSGFDPAYLYVVDNNKNNLYFTIGVNKGIDQALNDRCDFVWILNNDTEPDQNYLTASLSRFNQDPKIGIVGGKNLKTDRPDRIFWGGSYNAFPTGQHKTGYVSKNSLNTASLESWATFSSVVIRAQTLKDVGNLDPSMRMIFSDSDFCFSAARKGWQTWYEPKALIMHDCGVSNKGADKHMMTIFRNDKRAFHQKWKTITGCEKPEHLQEAIWLMTGFIKNW